MPEPAEFKFNPTATNTVDPENQRKEPPEKAEVRPLSAEPIIYANRFTEQKYHPVVLIGSASAGKTVMLLSLLSFFKANTAGNKLSVFFGDDLFSAAEQSQRNDADRYFHRVVADYIRGTTDVATNIGKPMFVPAKVCGQDGMELKFAFMESDGEWYQPDRRPDQSFVRAFKPELENLLKQYPDGISFLWVAPHMTASSPGSGLATDPDELMKQAKESLLGAMQNYDSLRRHNSARDTHMFIVTKWDSYVSEFAPADIRVNLDRGRDEEIAHEVDNFIRRHYSGPYGAFQALNCPVENKSVFRYSAGLFSDRSRGTAAAEDVLSTYPRDVWNWLYDGMRKGHDWPLSDQKMIPMPVKKPPGLLDRLFELLDRALGG